MARLSCRLSCLVCWEAGLADGLGDGLVVGRGWCEGGEPDAEALLTRLEVTGSLRSRAELFRGSLSFGDRWTPR